MPKFKIDITWSGVDGDGKKTSYVEGSLEEIHKHRVGDGRFGSFEDFKKDMDSNGKFYFCNGYGSTSVISEEQLRKESDEVFKTTVPAPIREAVAV